jgi:hypothetical protein
MKVLPIALLLCALLTLLLSTPASGSTAAQPSQSPGGAARSSAPQQTVRVTQLPPLSISKDWTDQAYWAFTFFLAIIGGFQAFLLWGNLRAIERQAIQMERQTGILQQSVALAEKSAETAKQNIELFVSRERAHLRVDITPLEWPLQAGIPKLSYRVTLHGATEAYVAMSCFRAELTDSPEPTDDGHWSPAMSIPQVITPDQRTLEVQVPGIYPKLALEQDDIDAVEAGKKFIHVRGFIKYNDVFGTERWTRFRRMWEISPLRRADGTRHGRWSRRGSANDNSET